MPNPITSGYLPVNGVDIYWESRGNGGTPLVVVYGGLGMASMFGELLDHLSAQRQVITIELQGIATRGTSTVRSATRPSVTTSRASSMVSDSASPMCSVTRSAEGQVFAVPSSIRNACDGSRLSRFPVVAMAGSRRSARRSIR